MSARKRPNSNFRFPPISAICGSPLIELAPEHDPETWKLDFGMIMLKQGS
jgi:hypothetical protein